MSAKECIEIIGDQARVKINGLASKEIPVTALVQALQDSGNQELFPGILPHGLRYFVRRNGFSIAVIEQVATPRTVFVPAVSRPTFTEEDRKQVRRRLSFPYIYLFVLFNGPALSNHQQLFYRTKPVTSLEDELYLCNLPNVVAPGSRTRWPFGLCISNIPNIARASWTEKINIITAHVWQSGWNWDFERSNMESMFSYYAKRGSDKRVCCFSAWEKETAKDPYFALNVKWKPAKRTVRDTIDQMLIHVRQPARIGNCRDLVNLLARGVQRDFFDLASL